MFRALLSVLVALLLVGVLAGIGTEIYQAGVAQGIVDAGRFPAGATVPVTGGYQGVDVLDLFVPILILFILFAILRAAFSGGRGWGHGYGHGYGHGHGWDRGWDRDDRGEGGPGSWGERRERRMAELHRRLHESEGLDAGGGGAGSTASGGAPAR